MSGLLGQVGAVAAVAGLAALWIAVLGAWRRAFPEAGADPDPLAGRLGCHGCGECDKTCGRERPGGARAAGEERS